MTAVGTWTLRGKALEREGRASGLAPPGYPHGRSSYPRTSTWHAAHQTTQNFCGAPGVRARARGYRPWSAAAPTCRSAGKLIAVWFDDKSRKVSSLVYLLSKKPPARQRRKAGIRKGPGAKLQGTPPGDPESRWRIPRADLREKTAVGRVREGRIALCCRHTILVLTGHREAPPTPPFGPGGSFPPVRHLHTHPVGWWGTSEWPWPCCGLPSKCTTAGNHNIVREMACTAAVGPPDGHVCTPDGPQDGSRF